MAQVAELMDRYFAAWGRGDVEAAMACYSAEVTMSLPGRSPVSGLFRGRDSVTAAIRSLTDLLDGPPDVTVEDIAYGERLVAVVVVEGVRRAGRELTFRRVVTYRVEDGEIRAIEIFHEDEYAVDEFFS
jgi:ketosteroid isomerase-like protein